ncbi:MAG: HipA domain-containing protein [Lachnospiraceae bacterium]|nr:HipA domain-containing protein [Lachnospiraceae bacterium]
MKGISNTFLTDNTLPVLDNWSLDMITAYSGSDRKEGLISPDGHKYLIKYAEAHTRVNDLDTSYVNNVISEYMASHILSIAGFEVHDTFIGTRSQNLLVACKNFTSGHQYLIEFGQYMRKHYDSGDIGRVPDIRQIEYVLHNDPVLCNCADELWASYWERFIGDALVGNFDRHMGNWGYITNTQSGRVYASPIYDNGSTLFPALSENAMREEILPFPKEILKRTLLFPKAALTVNGRKASYFDMLSSGFVPALSQAVRKIVPIILSKMPCIREFIDAQEFLSDTRKTFYKTMLDARTEYILKPAYESLSSGNYNTEALNRLQKGIEYTEKDFENFLCQDPSPYRA